MTRLACDRSWEAEAIEDGRSGLNERVGFERHAATCNVCTEAIEAQRRLRNLMQALPEFEAAPFAERRARAQLLQRANSELTHHRRYPAWLLAAAATVALAGLASAAIWRAPSNPSPASPQAPATAPGPQRAATSPRSRAPADPPQQAKGRPAAPAPFVAEPAPTVSEAAGSVRPSAQVRPPTPVEPVAPSQARNAPDPTSPANAPPLSPSASSARPKTAASSAGGAPEGQNSDSSSTDDFAQAVTAFQHRNYGEADRLFAAFRRSRPRDARGEDAAFLRAVARSRAGDATGAAALASEYLRAFPGGLRRAEAERLQRAVEKKE